MQLDAPRRRAPRKPRPPRRHPRIPTPRLTSGPGHDALTGAGSTFDQPFFTKAFYEYNKQNSGVTVNYASIGSGGGIEQFQANTVNFGAERRSDARPSTYPKATAGETLQVPVALGGEAISYNVPGVQGG